MNALSKKITPGSLLRFAAPTIIMMVFMSLYTMVDGIFVARFVDTNALSAVNIVYPILNVVIAIAIMLATGGSAVIASKLGENKGEEAKKNFSLIITVGVIIGCIISVLGIIFIEPIIKFLGATDILYDYCYSYALILFCFVPFGMLQMLYEYFFVVAGKPHIGLITIFIGGCANIALDYLFIAIFKMGVGGAALATGIGFSIPAIFGTIYFFVNRKNAIFFTKPKFDGKMLLKSCANGSSEMVTNLASAIATFLFNRTMLKLAGEDGVAAITIVMYGQFLLTAIYLGYSSGISPIISYNFGNKNVSKLKKTYLYSCIFIAVSSVAIFISSLLLSSQIAAIFAVKGSAVYELAKNGLRIFSIGYLFIGINIFSSAMFTALNNGIKSAIISFLRTFVFLISLVLLLPEAIGIKGVWLAVPLAEFLTLFISLFMIISWRKRLTINTL